MRSQEIYVLQDQVYGCEPCRVLVHNVRKVCGCELWIVGAKCEVARDICFAKSSFTAANYVERWFKMSGRKRCMFCKIKTSAANYVWRCWCKMGGRIVAANCRLLVQNVWWRERNVLRNQVHGCELRGVLVENVRKNFGCELWSVGVNCDVTRDICFARSSLRLRTVSSVGAQCEEDMWVRIVDCWCKM